MNCFSLAIGIILAAFFFMPRPVPAQEAAKPVQEHEATTANEDLMREHAVLERILLVFDEEARRLARREPMADDLVPRTARLVRSFIQDYHEKLEEDYVFPELRRENREMATVNVLIKQHDEGRKVIDRLMEAAKSPKKNSKAIIREINAFSRMYRPHMAREGTDVFRAFRESVPPDEYRLDGRKFEEREREQFHGDGFSKAVETVTGLEKELGINDLSQFTPRP